MKISVIIPAFNAAPYISKAIESCFAQTYPPHEIVVADDGSMDETAGIAARFGPPVRVVRLPHNVGLPAARNAAIEASTGDWLAFLDADDWFLPEKLERQRQCAAENPDAVLIYSGFRVSRDGVESSGRYYPPALLWPTLRYHCLFHVGTVMLRRGAFEAVGGFDPCQRIVEDWDLWLRLAGRFSVRSFAGVPEELAIYQRTPGSLSSNLLRMREAFTTVIEKRSLQGLSGLSRRAWRRKIEAYHDYDLSLELRGEGSPAYLRYMVKSIAGWPFPGEKTPIKRYKYAAVMVKQRLLARRRAGTEYPGG
jgi:glycosyltransferase involved in cell wall biosynthesis